VKNNLKTGAILIGIISILFLSGPLILPGHAMSYNPYTATYQTSESNYVASSEALGTTTAQYQVVNGVYSGQAENTTLSLVTTSYVGTSSGGNSSISMRVSSSYSNNDTLNTSISGSGGTLLYIAASQNGIDQIVWSGVAEINTTTPTTLSGLAYLNTSTFASLVLGFASTNGIEKATTQLGASAVVTVELPQFTFSSRSSSTASGNIEMIFPIRYKPISMSASSVNASASVDSPMISVGASAFLGTSYYPDMVWNGSNTATASFNGTSLAGKVTSRTAEFFGVNGTVAGYAQEFGLQSSKSFSILGQSVVIETAASSTLIVSQPETSPGNAQNGGSFTAMVNGEAVVFENNHGAISSTANIQSEHTVLLNRSSSGTLLLLSTTNESSYVLANFSDNSTQSVTQAEIQSQKQTTVSEGGSTYPAIQVNISTAGNVIFNVSDSYPSSIVFKLNSTGIFQLNSQNYWVLNGRVYVFDDPARTYFIADASTITARQSQTTGPTLSSTSTLSVSQTLAGSNSSSFELEIGIAIVVVIVSIGIILLGARSRRS
jgi:hypothetical protein